MGRNELDRVEERGWPCSFSLNREYNILSIRPIDSGTQQFSGCGASLQFRDSSLVLSSAAAMPTSKIARLTRQYPPVVTCLHSRKHQK
jgi:hypothetical protein